MTDTTEAGEEKLRPRSQLIGPHLGTIAVIVLLISMSIGRIVSYALGLWFGVGAFGVAVAALVYGTLLLLRYFAQGNFLYTMVMEGTVKTIMAGNSFSRHLMSFKGYHLNDPRMPWHNEDPHPRQGWRDGIKDKHWPDWEVLYNNEDVEYEDREWLLVYLGIYWIGWPWANGVYIYQFEWNETVTETKGEEQGKEKILARAEPTDFIMVADFTYAIVTKGAETSERLPVDLTALLTVAIRNPYHALFSGEDWLRRVIAATNRQNRRYVARRTYQGLIQESPGENEDKGAQFSAPIIGLTDRLEDDTEETGSAGQKLRDPHGLRGRYGVVIRTADLQTVELAKGQEKVGEAAVAEYVARQEAEATKIKGNAEADVIRAIGAAKAAAIQAQMTIIGSSPAGALVAQFSAIEAASMNPAATVVWGGGQTEKLEAVLAQMVANSGKGA